MSRRISLNHQKKVKYPQKRTMNFAELGKKKDMSALRRGRNIGAAAVIVVVLAAASAVRIGEVIRVKNEYTNMEKTVLGMEKQLEEYPDVKKEYMRISSDFLTEEERSEQDRIGILELIEASAGSRGRVESVQISGNMVTVTMAETTMDDVSASVAELNADERVAKVSVTTAGKKAGDGTVTAFIYVTLNPGGDGQ